MLPDDAGPFGDEPADETRLEANPFHVAADRGPTVSADSVEPHSWLPVDLGSLDDEPPEPPIIGPGLAYPGRRHVFTGEPESGKSFVALILCLHELRAGRAAMYVDLEMGRRETLARFRALGATDGELQRLIYLEPREPLTDPTACADIRALVADRNPSIVILDAYTGLLALHGLDPNSSVDIERLNATLVDPLRAHGAATVILDHLPKNKDGRGKFAIGSERKIGAADVHLGFEMVVPFGRGRTGLIKVTTHKDRPGYLPRPRTGEIELTSSPHTGLITWRIRQSETEQAAAGERPEFRPTNLMERVSRHLEAQAHPISRNELEKAVTGKAAGVRAAIDCLIREGFAGETSGNRGTRLVAPKRPFRDNDLVPTSSPPDRPDFVPAETEQQSQNIDLVPPRPDFVPNLVPSPRPPLTGGRRQKDEVNEVLL